MNNSATYWIDIDGLLTGFGLTRAALSNAGRVAAAVRVVAARMPTYITLKDVKKRWGKGQEDIFPVAQFEKLWGDMTALPELDCRFVAVPRERGQQLKEPAQLDAGCATAALRKLSLCARSGRRLGRMRPESARIDPSNNPQEFADKGGLLQQWNQVQTGRSSIEAILTVCAR